MFYQHNPFERDWENMHWGHAVSNDLVHWKELPDALYPDSLGTMFSGSAVVDKNNDAGWGKNALVAIYTAAGKKMTQNLAYSLDNGRTFKKYEGNPVLGADRDPKVFWYEPTKTWVLVKYNVNYNEIFNSKDLKHWTYKSKVDGFYECPEFFELAVDGNPKNKKWVMYGASGTYMIGKFDGAHFVPESGKYMYTSGSLYAAQTYNNVPDGRRIQIGWGRIDQPGMPFNQLMLFPNELTLKTTREGVRMFCVPAREISNLHTQKHEWKNATVDEVNKGLSQLTGELYHGVLDFELDKGLGMELHFRGNPIVYYDGNFNTFNHINYINEDPQHFRFRVEFLIDRTSVEAYMGNGKLFLSDALKHSSDKGLKLVGDIKVHSLELYELKGIW
jgi:sucrose-6-phosphate hydrolase SacC (GH32 family)